jgi:quercetin dioxygenase-like cupin family protein
MSVPLIREQDVEEAALPGRRLRWLLTPDSAGAKHLSMCSIRVAPGESVRPAHSHPNGEEAIYIIRGCGRVLVDGEVAEVGEGTAVLFPRGSVHMLQNTSAEEMKVVCFFAPPSDLSTYKFFEQVEFPGP